MVGRNKTSISSSLRKLFGKIRALQKNRWSQHRRLTGGWRTRSGRLVPRSCHRRLAPCRHGRSQAVTVAGDDASPPCRLDCRRLAPSPSRSLATRQQFRCLVQLDHEGETIHGGKYRCVGQCIKYRCNPDVSEKTCVTSTAQNDVPSAI